MCKANTPLPPKRKNQLQRHQSQNHIQQVGYLFIYFFKLKPDLSLFLFAVVIYLVFRRTSLSASLFHTCEKPPNSQSCTQKTCPVLCGLHAQTCILSEPGSWQDAQVDPTRFAVTKWNDFGDSSQWKTNHCSVLFFLLVLSGQIGRSPTSSTPPAVKSPGQGLRLGLSRLVRVKPLHPGVGSQWRSHRLPAASVM